MQDRTMPLVLRATGNRRWRREPRVAQGVDAIDFQKLLALPCAVWQDAPVAVQPAPTHTRAFAREALHKIGRHAVVARSDDLSDCGALQEACLGSGLGRGADPEEASRRRTGRGAGRHQ